MNLVVHPCFDSDTSSWTYVLAHPATGRAAIVDPVMGYDPVSDTLNPAAADSILELIEVNGYCVEWILETDLHADHLSAARYLKSRLLCAQIAIGEHVRDVQTELAPRLGLDIATDGRQFDRLLSDGERLRVGHACGRVLHTPGHTAACASYLFDDFVFVGDTVFMPDHGTARCDLTGGDPVRLFRSIQQLYALPGATRMMVCHDDGESNDRSSGGRVRPRCSTTVAEQRRSNRMLRPDTPLAEFVAARRSRDRELAAPRLMQAALMANLRGGVSPGELTNLAAPRAAPRRAVA